MNFFKLSRFIKIYFTEDGEYPLELCYGFIQDEYRGKKLYSVLQKTRLEYIKNNKNKPYVLYTEFDYLKDSHIKYGMKSISTNKVKIDGIDYWKL